MPTSLPTSVEPTKQEMPEERAISADTVASAVRDAAHLTRIVSPEEEAAMEDINQCETDA